MEDVSYQGGALTVRGGRAAIAHVGAALEQAGWVPPDLSVQMPSLEDALVDLLERAGPAPALNVPEPELIGALR